MLAVDIVNTAAANRAKSMIETPFQLVIKTDDGEITLSCRKLLREVPGTRRVYDALQDGQPVIAKVFCDKLWSREHLDREWRHLKLLAERNLNGPEPLRRGLTEAGDRVLTTAKIEHAVSALDQFESEGHTAGKTAVLQRIAAELAKYHQKGVVQKDLHLGNFLVSNGTTFALDAAKMEFGSGPVGKNAAVSQAALLACYLAEESPETARKVCQAYFGARGWEMTEADAAEFDKQLKIQRSRQIERALRKCLRTNKRHIRIQNEQMVAVFDREFADGDSAAEFTKKVDTLLKSGETLKDSNTTCVSRVKWNGRDAVIKRFNHKGPLHSLRHTLKGSRAKRAWVNANRLMMLRISTPRPLAYIERYNMGMVWECYLITEYVDGPNLYLYMIDGRTTKQDIRSITEKIKRLFAKLEAGRITHGDLKYANIFVVEGEPILMDLDSMVVHRLDLTHKLWMDADYRKFAKKGEALGCRLDI